MTTYSEFYKQQKEKLLEQEKALPIVQEFNQDVTMTEAALDPILSFSNKFVGSAVQVIDLPLMLFDAIESGKDFAFKKIATAAGMSEADADEIINYGNSAYNIEKFRPGDWINKNILNDAANYESKTPVGETVGKMGEYIPYALLAPTTKAKIVFSGTGAASGLLDQAATKITDSDAVGTGVGVGANILLDILSIRKGKLAGLVDQVMPDKKTIDEAKKLQEYAKKYGLNLTTGEATQMQSILKLEGATTASLIGNKVLDTFWKNRPNQLKSFIRNWGKQNGLLPDSAAISSTKINEQVQKVALNLTTARSNMWKKSGGEKFNKSFFDQKMANDLSAELREIAKDAPDDIAKFLTKQADVIKKTKGSGERINYIYQDFRDGYYDALRTGNTLNGKSYEKAKDAVKKLLSTNSDWVKANKKYQVFSDTYEKPLSKGSVTKLFNDLKDGKWQTDAKTNATLYKYITSNDVRPADIEKMVNAINKSGVQGAWENIASDFFNSAFNKAAIDNMNRGLNTGNNFYNAILKTPRNKENFTEVIFQLAKKTDKNVKRSDIKKAVTSFADVLKASTAGGKVGSSTATNINVKEKLTESGSEFLDINFFVIKKWFGNITLSKSSQKIAESMVSEKGIQAFIDLAQNWKDKNKAVILLRTLTIGSEELE